MRNWVLSENIRADFLEGKKNSRMRYLIPAIIIAIFHIVGFIGIRTDPDFIRLTPVNLIVSAIVLFIYHPQWNRNFLMFFLTIPIAGFLAEAIGVNTGILFGNYSYSGALGFQVFNTPLIIGLNWLMLVYAVSSMAAFFRIPKWGKVFFASALLLIMDFALEPFAIEHHLWEWENGVIPLKNYISWFSLGIVFCAIFYLLPFEKKNPVAFILFFSQLFFFFALG